MNSIQISAVICTHNRAGYLKKSIESLVNQNLDNEKYEIIVIDNCSTDETAEVVNNLKRNSNIIRYIYEPSIGLSNARNTGWENAGGNYVAYLDDDAIAQNDWLSNIIDSFTNIKPEPDVIGGKIEPVWESERPDWLTENLQRALSVVSWSDHALIINNTSMWIAGANIAYRKDLLEKYNGFNTELGRIGKKLLSGEEILLNKLIIRDSYNVYYVPSSKVKHHIPVERMHKEWFIRRYYYNGISGSLIDCELNNLSFFDRVRNITKSIFKTILLLSRYVFSFFYGNGTNPGNFETKCQIYFNIGYIYGLSLTGRTKGENLNE